MTSRPCGKETNGNEASALERDQSPASRFASLRKQGREVCRCHALRFPHRPGSHVDCVQRVGSFQGRRAREDEERERWEMIGWQR